MWSLPGLAGLLMSVFACWLWYSLESLADTSPIVRTKNGALEGTIMRSKRGREFAAFRGIPYAQPPLGQLRFEPPVPFHSWAGIRSAKKDGDICPQRNSPPIYEAVSGSEDCLYLNVYSPKLFPDGGQSTNHPVMIWFHGGAWVVGSAHSSLYPPTFFLDHDIVLVTVNYRLGALGYLSTADLVVPGNQGMKDQAQSIRWVHENIAAFGGDPNLVTIFGESAGASAVHYHMSSHLSRGLFHRAISQSGTADCLFAVFRPEVVRNRTNRLGKRLGCPTGDSEALVECLKKKDAEDFVMTDDMFQVFKMSPLAAYRPVIEPDHPGAFIKDDPDNLPKPGNVADVPWIAGFNSHEGALWISALYGESNHGVYKILDEKFMELGPASLLYEDICPEKLKENVTKSIRKFYLADKKIDESTRMDMIDMCTDAWMRIGIDRSVEKHLKTFSSPVYYYYLAYRGSASQSAAFGDPDRNYGVVHGDELQYFFPRDQLFGTDLPYSGDDEKMVDLMITLWVNFARSGDPTAEKTLLPIKWEPVRTSALEYLHIGGPQDLRMEANLFPKRRDFWSSIPYRGKLEDEYNSSRTREEL